MKTCNFLLIKVRRNKEFFKAWKADFKKSKLTCTREAAKKSRNFNQEKCELRYSINFMQKMYSNLLSENEKLKSKTRIWRRLLFVNNILFFIKFLSVFESDSLSKAVKVYINDHFTSTRKTATSAPLRWQVFGSELKPRRTALIPKVFSFSYCI